MSEPRIMKHAGTIQMSTQLMEQAVNDAEAILLNRAPTKQPNESVVDYHTRVRDDIDRIILGDLIAALDASGLEGT